MISRIYVSLLLCAFLFGVATPAYAVTAPNMNFHYQRLFYWRDGPLATKSLYAHYASIDIFAPQSYKVNGDGSLSGSLDKDVLAFTKAHKMKVMPLVTNGGFSRAASKEFLGDAQKESTAIAAMIAEAHDRSYWGWQVDFEQMDATDSAAYSEFIEKAYAAFKAKGLMLSVAVVSKISDNPKDYKEGLWDNLIGVYDYTRLAASSDFITVMSYDDPDSKGPIAPFPWYNQVFTYALAHVPNNKISLGIPVYYWQWNDTTQKLIGIGGAEGLDLAMKKHAGATISYDAVQKAPVIRYSSLGSAYSIWYENAKSIGEKVSLVTQNHLYGLSGWVLGLELPSTYLAVKE
jgi:spore germination protein YaaH